MKYSINAAGLLYYHNFHFLTVWNTAVFKALKFYPYYVCSVRQGVQINPFWWFYMWVTSFSSWQDNKAFIYESLGNRFSTANSVQQHSNLLWICVVVPYEFYCVLWVCMYQFNQLCSLLLMENRPAWLMLADNDIYIFISELLNYPWHSLILISKPGD